MKSREERLRKIEMKMRHIKVVGSDSAYALRIGLVALAALSAGMLLLCFWALRGERRQAQRPPAVIQIVDEEGKQDLREIVREEYATYQTDMQNMLAIAGIVFTLFSIGIPIMQYVFIQKERVEELEKMMLLVEDEREKVEILLTESQEKMDVLEEQIKGLKPQLVRMTSEFDKLQLAIQTTEGAVGELKGDVKRFEGITGQYGEQLADITQKLSSLEQPKPQEAVGGSKTGGEHLRAGNKAFKEGKYEDAIKALNKAIIYYEDESDDKNLAVAFYNRGLVYSTLDKFEEALADYTKAIELKPDKDDFYINRGVVFYNLDKFEEALADYSEAIELNSDDAMPYNNRGNAYLKLEKFEEALSDYDKAIELKSDYILAYRNRAILHDAMGNHGLAEKDRSTAKRLEEEQEKKEN